MDPIDTNPNEEILWLQPADPIYGEVVTTGHQTFCGSMTFNYLTQPEE